VRQDGYERRIQDVRDLIAEAGGMGFCGVEALAILKRVGLEEAAFPGPDDELNNMEQAVIELRRVMDGLRDDWPLAPGEKPGRPYVSERAWGLRHASLCGWAARLAIVGNPAYADSPLLAEAIELRAELLQRSEVAGRKARGDR
jgi:hypothetical protein